MSEFVNNARTEGRALLNVLGMDDLPDVYFVKNPEKLKAKLAEAYGCDMADIKLNIHPKDGNLYNIKGFNMTHTEIMKKLEEHFKK